MLKKSFLPVIQNMMSVDEIILTETTDISVSYQ